jgi:hypothetical protein
MLILCCVLSHTNNDDHGVRRGNTAWALTQWQRLEASHEATVALYWVMLITLYRPGSMVIKIAVKLVTLVKIIDKSAGRKKILGNG